VAGTPKTLVLLHKRKEKEISAKIHLLRNKYLDLLDQFVSMAEREIDII